MTTFTKIALCALTLGIAAPALAEPIDIANITCEGFAGLDDQTKGALIMWMDGYTGAADPSRSLLDVMTEVTSG